MCRFIDYEYAGFNPVALDIANHWCEYAADYHTSEPHLLDFKRFPGDKQQKLFTRAYVRAVIALKQQKEEMVGLLILDLNCYPSTYSMLRISSAYRASFPGCIHYQLSS